MYDVITIGSATRDVFVRSSAMEIRKDTHAKTGRAICFSLGSKVELDDIHFDTGGGAMNSAVTFARQGLKTALVTRVGADIGGRAAQEYGQKYGIDFLVKPTKGEQTAYSLLLASSGGERTVLVYRGISEHFTEKEIPWAKLNKARWWYMTTLGGDGLKILIPLLHYAKKHGVSVALSPGRAELLLHKRLAPLLRYAKVLLLNKEEASYVTGVSYQQEEKIFSILDKWVSGIIVMTDGPKGVKVSDGVYRWSAGVLREPKLVDRTGAGDAFGSGFVSAIMHGKSVEEAMQLGSANATGVIGEWGASKGLLGRRDSLYKFGKLHITKREI